ncbi:MAG TPA: GPW/gp25 family protein [Kofleriaceae bacterium]|nr:GPW/gp25 family protein [Kofleriaceae bacterium]
MGKEFIGKGWKFPIVPDSTGALAWSVEDENVEHSLQVLLMTRIGERVMRRDFGSRLGELVFRPGSEQNLREIEREVRAAIARWEPRVDVLDVRAEADADDATHVTVSLSYRVRRTNTRDSLVFPFYLLPGSVP